MGTNTETYTNSSGLKQDLLNALKLIQEDKTPMVSRLKTSTAKQRLHQWVSDRITTPAANAAAVEGAAFNASAAAAFTTTDNYTQIVREDFAISGTMEASEYAGVSSTVSYQKQKALKSIGTKLEYAIVNSTGNTGTSGTAREMRGFAYFGTASGNTATASSGTALGTSAGENAFVDMLQALYDDGVEADFAYMSLASKRQIDKWTASSTKFVESKTMKLPAMVNIYESSFGIIEMIFSAIVPNSAIYAAPMDALRVAYLRKPFSEIQGKNGDAFPVMVLLEATLEVLDPLAVGKVTLS